MQDNKQETGLLKDALIGGSINALINGISNWFSVDRSEPILLTQNLVSSDTQTVFSGAVTLSVSLAFVISSITFFSTRIPGKPPYFPKVFLLALKHCAYAFGLVTIAGLLLQRFAGSIEVNPLLSAIITGLIAGCVGTIVSLETRKSLLQWIAQKKAGLS